MPRKGTNAPKQDYKYLGILYPDSEAYDFFAVKAKIKEYFGRWAFMVHDADLASDGTTKKTHVHFVAEHLTEEGKASPVSLDAVAKSIGLEQRDLEYCKSVKSSIRYLCHIDDDDKAQYRVEDIETNWNVWKYFKDKKMSRDSKRIFDFIVQEKPYCLESMLSWVFEEGLYAEFRRGWAIWDSLLREVTRDG